MTDPSASEFELAGRVIEPEALIARIAASDASTAAEYRETALAELRAVQETARARIAAALADAPLCGPQAARAYSRLMDGLVRTALEVVSRWLHPNPTPTESQRIAVLAVGGFGRAEMAPFSDVDLLFLTPYKQTAWGESLIEAVLYLLWDLKLKVGQSVRTIEQCLRLGREDMTIRTSLLERRLIWGDESLSAELDTRIWDELFRDTGPAFVEAKLAERETRHEKNGGSRYLVEPNVKESKGGLRDLQALYWIEKYLYNVDSIRTLVDKGVFSEDEYAIFSAAESFLWSVRCHLHLAAGRATEQLGFDMQVEVARAMGFEDADGQRGVERFMQVYFLHARSVGELSRIFLVALEATHIKQRPSLSRAIGGLFSRDRTPDGFALADGRLTVEDPDAFLADPVNLLRLFQVGVETGALIHPDALRLATANLDLLEQIRGDERANRIFLHLLVGNRNPERGLRRMNETGVLGAFLPEFGRIVAMMQFNMYHHYTVDEHTITCISVMSKIERGELEDELPYATEIMAKDINRRALYVAMLLHDIGKGRSEDHSELGAEMAAEICPRLGLDEADTELVVWLVRHHLLMSDTAQKRDISDPRTVSDFAKTVASMERLRLLLVLTVCDIRGVGPNTWNNWKATLLRQLYSYTADYLTDGLESPTRDQREEDAKAALAEALSDMPAEQMQAELERHYTPYWLGLSTATQVCVARMIPAVDDDRVESDFVEDPERDATRVTFVNADHPGVFARLAGALALVGANVLDARTYTTSDGYAISVFWIQDADETPYEKARLKRLRDTVMRTLMGEVVARAALDPKDKIKRREKDFIVPTRIRFDNQGSDLFTIVEVDTRDRPGLLHDLTRALAASNVNIFSAIIATYGEQAVDTFYVKDLFGMKLTSESKRRQVERALRDAVMRRPEGTR
ncbi:[protein-PII] uridylyltransferase [Pontivivens ytuae]|uniref:Bifunctional uridylyltransferase/uridylyl-removing enzyme n=1 Tax=Pontivivens ytuae TaxID=2789856 RepID=A0A7S9QB07_9RHOB|nr:[protein-PII] uridylyltransferase [Pontivivens ytuae]QPH52653.1 [protein-PII] uridylyltransferase [Pontivivens ytuae]